MTSGRVPRKLDQSARSPVDMSPEAISQRLDECAAISELCIELSKAKIVGPVADLEPTHRDLDERQGG